MVLAIKDQNHKMSIIEHEVNVFSSIEDHQDTEKGSVIFTLMVGEKELFAEINFTINYKLIVTQGSYWVPEYRELVYQGIAFNFNTFKLQDEEQFINREEKNAYKAGARKLIAKKVNEMEERPDEYFEIHC
ncbi:hypothetical protein MY04_05870 (plasmid) [Flammeovirga sp. MY04]|uniref:hypothetical protein n=1 Tax=Flammeovirga sp. MY04 TaxID=1191459 RepID=UPI00080614A4|nr:hypothetical protein [Flammeovirga sp. MY04]ANQ52906.1 hypothetical protein MY04_05870 [Flammeovirga sp. MY04]